VVSELELAGAEVVISEHPGDWTFTTERFRAIDDADVDLVIFRDADSRLNFRESAAVEEWVNTNKTLHIMRDHPHHGGFPILAGMWGLKKDGFKFNMSSLLQIHNCAEQYHYDQIFLQAYIWRFYESDCLVHDEFFGGLPFPSARIGTEYVGKPFEADDLPSLPQDEKYFI
jgi:hypothetical protein